MIGLGLFKKLQRSFDAGEKQDQKRVQFQSAVGHYGRNAVKSMMKKSLETMNPKEEQPSGEGLNGSGASDWPDAQFQQEKKKQVGQKNDDLVDDLPNTEGWED